MKIVDIAKTNSKGQLVIPKEMREALGIDSNVLLNLVVRGSGIYIQPISEIVTRAEIETSYLRVLEKTRGTWRSNNWERTRKKKKRN